MTEEQRAIYERMPADAKGRVDRIEDEALRELCIDLWLYTETKPSGPAQADVDYVNAALEGRIGHDDKSRQQIQDLMRVRVQSLFRQTGKRVGELATSDPALHERFVGGCVRCIRRWSLSQHGQNGEPPHLSAKDLAYLKRREMHRRDLNRYDDLADVADSEPQVSFYERGERA